MKAFFEDPALLVGWPFIVVGALGLFLAVGAWLEYVTRPSEGKHG
jgi:hypothetical protein